MHHPELKRGEQMMLLPFLQILIILFLLLLQVSYMELKDATESRYYHYRESQLLDLDDSTM